MVAKSKGAIDSFHPHLCVVADWNVQLLALNPNDEVVAIRIFRELPPEFTSERELNDWSEEHINSAVRLQENIGFGCADLNDDRIVSNPKLSRPAVVLKNLQTSRDSSKYCRLVSMCRWCWPPQPSITVLFYRYRAQKGAFGERIGIAKDVDRIGEFNEESRMLWRPNR